MGRNRKSRGAVNLSDTASDDDTFSTTSSVWSENAPAGQETEKVNSLDYELEKHLEALYEKRGSTREKALAGLIEAFECHLLIEFVENKSITLLSQFINSIKKGSSKEVSLASRAIGLLAITNGSGGKAHEIMQEAIPQLSQALKSGSDLSKKPSVLDCLAVIFFIGGDEVEETERSMKIIWESVNPKAASNVTASKPTPALLTSAISAWSLLLTTMDQRRTNSMNWQESISFLSNLLDKDDRSVRIAAGEALALIFEKCRFDKYSRTDKGGGSVSAEGNKTHEGITYIESLKGKILNQARSLSMEAGGKGSAKTDLNAQRDLFQRVVSFIESGEFDEVSVKVLNNCSPLRLSTWAESIQLNFLKRFLGGGYLKHMKENELLHDVFDYVPKKRDNLTVKEKRMFLSPNSVANKERTQFLNKRRSWAQDRNQGHFAIGAEDY